MVWIATSGTLTSNTSEINFSSIPTTFTHLQIRIFGRGTTSFSDGLTLYTRLNNDSGANYADHQVFGNGSSAFSSGGTSKTQMDASQVFADSSATANIYGVTIVDILDYANTNKNTTIRTLGGWDGSSTKGRATLASGLWMNTAAVNAIKFLIDGSFVAGTRADLYGITSSQVTGA
jgi:hypothetical protein